MAGQILPDSPFGKALIEVIKEHPHLKIFVDDGMWCGGGSTKCLVEALKDVQGAKVIAIEANAAIFKKAQEYWANKPSFLEMRWGRIGQRMMTEAEVRRHPYFQKVRQHFDLYWDQDCADFRYAPLIDLPRYVDGFVLDAGEFGGIGSLDRALMHKPSIIALDDINVIKHDASFKHLVNSGEWRILKRGNDRNGWAILRRESSGTYDRYCEVGFAGVGC